MDALLEIDAALYFSSMQSYRQSIDVCSESIDTLNIAKTLSFLLPGLPRRGSSFQKLKDFAGPFSEMQSSRVVSLSSAPAGCATLHSTTRDHCGALRISSLNMQQVRVQ